MARWRGYLALTKPGIVMGNAITAIGGFALASRGSFDWGLFLLMLLGLSLIVGAGCAFNNYIDRVADGKMERTKNRPFVKGVLTPQEGLSWAGLLLVGGSTTLLFGVNLLVLLLSLLGFVIYLFFYSLSKYRTVHATLIGSIAGAIPPVVGYCAVSNRLDVGALILFLIITLWQMPHFYAIALYRIEEYSKASIPVMPIVKGLQTTKIHMLLYVAGFIAAALLLPLFHYVGLLYVVVIASLGLAWLLISFKGFKCTDEKQWARKMFFCSLAVVMGTCIVIPLSVI